MIANIVSILRNLLFTKVEPTWPLKIFFIALQIVFTAIVGIATAFELLPIIAVILFTFSLSLKTDVQFKLALIAGQLLWLTYDIHHSNYVAMVADILSVCTTTAGIVMILRGKASPAEAY